ncbi:hypothetical protein K7432_008574 [Basidiobolus ranarum]|uniref:Uncharacterized protein n=1 Tax=Basidiobolus ranarum TaxID=34480 RepID=A0ABR2WRL1_9FUNG
MEANLGRKGGTGLKTGSYSDKSSTSPNQPGKDSSGSGTYPSVNPGDKGSSMGHQNPAGGGSSDKYTAPAKDGYTKGSKTASPPSCNDICNSLSLLGVKVDASICLSKKNIDPTASVFSADTGCATLIANAKLLGIAHVDVSLCH